MDESTDLDTSEWSHLSEAASHERQIQSTVKEMLMQKVFVGEYTERHYVDSLKSYRDLVIVEPEEKQLIQSLNEVKNLLQNYYGTAKWLGITNDMYDGTPQGQCLWVQLSQIPLGKHWFQVTSVKFKDYEIIVRLKFLRPFQTSKDQTPNHAFTTQTDHPEYFDIQKFYNELEWSQIIELWKQKSFEAFYWSLVTLKTVLSFQNLREAIKFSSVLILTIVTFLIEAARFLGDYSIKLFHETARVIRALTPIILGLIEFCTKCVGGFYLLILMLWRGSSAPSIPPNALKAAFDYNGGPNSRKSIGYNDFQSPYSYSSRKPQYRGRYA